MKRSFWIVLCLLSLVAAWLMWPSSSRLAPAAKKNTAAATAPPIAAAVLPATNHLSAAGTTVSTNKLAYRLSNTSKSLGQLVADRHAILLENALIDTTAGLSLNIPDHLKAKGDPGAYIVQARGAIDAPFRALLAAAGAQIVSYIPNNAYLVRLSAAGAAGLAGNALVQAVLPFEPYYKLQPSLLGLAVLQKPLTPGTALNLGLFAADAPAAERQIENLGGKIMGRDQSPFGPVLRVLAPANWTALAQVTGVQVLEVSRQRVLANDLSRVTVGVAADTQTTTNWLSLTGAGVLVAVDDTGIDATHPDLTGRVSGPNVNNDTAGHGTHVAGTIAGDGTESITVTNAEGSIMPATNGQFRGMAPLANLFSMDFLLPDQSLQQGAALTNALISNNSWNYSGDFDYDLAAASYDAATRDALPGTTGSQPVLFVFSGGNNGGGNDNGAGGAADTIQSPGTAKNVITVGALEQPRGITNIVTKINSDGTTNTDTPWFGQTDSGSQVAGYSARGNVGVQTEGPFGRFKPDVVTPGTFVVSTRSSQWDTNAYFNPTNVSFTPYTVQFVPTNSFQYYSVSVPPNAISVTITITSNRFSQPFPPNLPIYVAQTGIPGPSNNVIVTSNNSLSIPADGGSSIATYQNNGFGFAVGNSTNVPVFYDVTVAIRTTNNLGDYYQVLHGMDDSLGGFYRYESGTSMSAANVSGVLALMQDYFNQASLPRPSPALLKAMLINGSRSDGGYSLAVTNGNNFQGWGLANIENSLPLTNISQTINAASSGSAPMFFVDQSPANALATGDRHTYTINIDTANSADFLPLQATLVWSDPPGDPAAAIKLVNSLTLIITNLDNRTQVYYGNDISSALGYNLPASTSAPNVDAINNVQNILLPAQLAGHYWVTVVGRSVNVNAVTAQTNNVVQDYALVVSVGEGEVPTAISSVADNGIVSKPTTSQDITGVTSTNTPLLNQLVGASTPLLGTNALPLGAGSVWGPNGQLTIGMTNQWHFYLVTNNALDSAGSSADVTNAAFITFDPSTLSIPRMGVNADSVANATRPEADIEVFVSTDPSLTNLNPVVISNCINSTQVGASVAGGFNGAALSRGGTEFVADTNSTHGQVYYVGVQSEDQMASEYGFMSVFTSTPFSQINSNGDQVVNGLLLPTSIPDGDNAHPGVATVFALAIYPMQAARVTVTNLNEHQNFGDLFGAVSFGGTSVVLNNHDGLHNTFGTTPLGYDDSANPATGTQHTDGPGSLQSFIGKSSLGPWILTEVDNALTQTGRVSQYNLVIKPHHNLTGSGITVSIPPSGFFSDFVDVPAGYTGLTFAATNLPPIISPPLQMFEKFNAEPTPGDFDQEADLTNTLTGLPAYPAANSIPGNAITVGPPLLPGRYWVGITNPSTTVAASVFISASLNFNALAKTTVDFRSTGPVPLLDDAVTTDTILVTNTDTIQNFNVGLRVDHPRISDLVFNLITPDGTRYLLMENRGALSTNGCGVTIFSTNAIANFAANGVNNSVTNPVSVSQSSGTLPISWDFFPIPDEMTVYDNTNSNYGPANKIFDTGPVSGPGQTNLSFTTTDGGLAIIMNQFSTPTNGDQWTYTAGGVTTNYEYLAFTEDTNLTTTPIKFAVPPFIPSGFITTNLVASSFEQPAAGDFTNGTSIVDNSPWQVTANQVTVVNDAANAQAGSQFLALANGTISNNIPTVPGTTYTLSYNYRGPGIVSFWRGENNTNDSINANPGTWTGLVGGSLNTYGLGEVGQTFIFNGLRRDRVDLGNPASLQLQTFTITAWVKRSDTNNVSLDNLSRDGGAAAGGAVIVGYGQNGYALGINDFDGRIFETQVGVNGFFSTNAITDLNWHHVALVKGASTATLYMDGSPASPTTSYNTVFQFSSNIAIGSRGDAAGGTFLGMIDEPAIYKRPLSASEIKAIYSAGSAGDFDSAAAFPQNLAKAVVSIPGVSTSTIFGNNTNWQSQTITFTATGTTTPLVISGIEPGMLLDSFAISAFGSGSNLDYLPEQDISGITGTPANGTGRPGDTGVWQLEVLDNRAGASNNATLVSWQLEFTFANTNFIPPVPPTIIILTNLVPSTNSTPVPSNGVVFYQVNVPLNADFATNRLLFADAPLNVWWSTNFPPTVGQPNDVLLISGTSGSFPMNLTNTVPLLVPGTTYYLGVQNPNSFAVTNYAVEVDFHLIGQAYAFTEPATLVTGTSAQLNGMATPNGYPSTAWFEWGTNTLYGNQTAATPVGAGFNVVFTTGPISGLVTNVAYHFRLVVSNAVGVVDGFDQVLDEANVVAWGADYAGQINVPTNLNNVTAIAGAYDHSLALQTNGLVAAWGDNTFGQATVPASVSNVVAVAGGQYYSLVLKSDQTVTAWGASILNSTNVPAGLNSVVEIAGGQYSSLALQNNGTVVAWGATFFGLTNVPVSASNTVAIAGGNYHSLALKNDGTVTVWGDDSSGQTNLPTSLTNVVAIAAGGYHSLALRNDGTVVAWGDDSVGQTNVPASATNVVAIAAGGFHSLALKADGTVVAWGDDSAGQLNIPSGLTNMVAISAGYLHSLALTSQTLTNFTVLPLTAGAPVTNNILGGDITYYQVNVPANADFSTNTLLFASAPLNVWFSTNTPPHLNATNATQLMAGVTNGVAVLYTNLAPALVPGSTYYLGVQNPNNFTVSYAVEVTFHLVTSTNVPPPTNTVSNFSIVHTNSGFLLTWFAPSNDLFQVQWTPSLAPTNWQTFTNIVSYNTSAFTSPTNTQFNFFDDGSQTGGFGPTRFYRLILLTTPPVITVTNPVSIASIVQTNIATVPGYWLTWFAPSNDLFQVEWTASLAPASWTPFTNIVSYNPSGLITPTNAQFNFFDDGSQTGGVFGPTRFYRLILYGSASAANTLTLPNQTNLVASAGNPVTVTNMATDSNPAAALTYSLINPPAGAGISTNGIITWTNATPSGLAARFNTLVTDNGSPAASATNTFTIFVAPFPSITNVTVTATNVTLSWSAPTNDQFQVQWTTNLVSPINWTPFPGTITSTNSLFSFTDTNAPLLMKFYELILLP